MASRKNNDILSDLKKAESGHIVFPKKTDPFPVATNPFPKKTDPFPKKSDFFPK